MSIILKNMLLKSYTCNLYNYKFLLSPPIYCIRCLNNNYHIFKLSNIWLRNIEKADDLNFVVNKKLYSSTTAAGILKSIQFIQIRNKHKKNKNTNRSDDDSDDDDDDDLSEYLSGDSGRDEKVLKSKLTSLRTDLIIKSGLGVARNKIEALFYENKIRVNGEKILKKSLAIAEGDEIDVIKNISPMNPNHLIVSRIEVLNTKPGNESITVIMKRYKSLTIENYQGSNAWKSSSEAEHIQ